MIRAYQAGAIPKTKVTDVVDQWEKSDHPAFWNRNMNSLYNAFTEVYKGNLVALPNRSDALHSVLDTEVGFDFNFNEVEEAELVPVEAVEQATEVELVGANINGEVPAEIYGDDPF